MLIYVILIFGDDMEIRKFVLGPIKSNCYIVTIENHAMVIDPGFPEDTIIKYLEANNLSLDLIYITHGHFDHWGGLNMLKEKYPQALSYAPKKDMIWMNENNHYNRWGYPAMIDHYIDENDEIHFQNHLFKIIETPGHSIGGTVLYDEFIAFTGDTLFYQTVGRTDIPFSDMNTLYFSVKKMFKVLNNDTICYPGHGRTTTIGHEKKYNPFVKEV